MMGVIRPVYASQGNQFFFFFFKALKLRIAYGLLPKITNHRGLSLWCDVDFYSK